MIPGLVVALGLAAPGASFAFDRREPPTMVDASDDPGGPPIDPTIEPDHDDVPPPPVGVSPLPPDPVEQALHHLARAQELSAAGDLASAEAEVSVAIALAPEEGAAYLQRAQVRTRMAELGKAEDEASRRARATLLRQAADDVASYLARVELDPQGRTWFEARADALRRDADALDPPRPQLAPRPQPEPSAELVSVDRRRTRRSRDPVRSRTLALTTTGALLGAAGAGLAAASLRIEQSCGPDGLCSAQWSTRPGLLAPASLLTVAGTSALVVGIVGAPALREPQARRTVGITTLALGSVAVAVGTITASLVGARWSSPVAPSDTRSLGMLQATGNAAASSFAIALPLLGSGLTALLHHRRASSGGDDRVAGRGRRTARR